MSNLSAQERAEKNFRERIYYWENVKKLTPELAIEKAKNPRPKRTRKASEIQTIEAAQQNEKSDLQEPENQKSDLPKPENQKSEISDPTPEQIQTEIDRLKRLGVMTEITCSSAGNNLQKQPEKNPENAPPDNSIELGICILVAICAAGILVKNTAEVWNYSVEGWIKAAILEIGICGFSIYRPHDNVLNVLTKLVAGALIGLSLMTQYTGVARHESNAVSMVESSEETISNLRTALTLAKETHSLAAKWQKAETLKEVNKATEKLNIALEAKQKPAAVASDVSVVKLSSIVELCYRAAFMLVFIGFSARTRQLLQKALRRRGINLITNVGAVN